MANQDLINYIKKSFNSGFSKEQIKINLVKIGWLEKDIEEVFLFLNGGKVKSEQENIKQQLSKDIGTDNSVVPNEIKKWNWGAFFLTFIWGIANKVYISFLAFVPVIGIITPFLLGAKGNKWAWKKKKWRSVEHFLSVQKKWAIWGLVIFVIFILLLSSLAVAALNSAKTRVNDAYRIADIKQVQTALELYYSKEKEYPDSNNKKIKIEGICLTGNGFEINCSTEEVYMSYIPSAPLPSGSGCTDAENSYSYERITPDYYKLYYCLGTINIDNKYEGEFKKGVNIITPKD